MVHVLGHKSFCFVCFLTQGTTLKKYITVGSIFSAWSKYFNFNPKHFSYNLLYSKSCWLHLTKQQMKVRHKDNVSKRKWKEKKNKAKRVKM